jgi:hypothetical protein
MDKYLKSLLYLVILIVLIIITVFVLRINHKSTLSEKSTQFAVKDTQNISKIFMADMTGKTVLLERKTNEWVVNGKYDANQDRVDLLLETIASIEVKNPVPLSAEDNVIKSMSSSSIKVEIYTTKKKPFKVYYVGGPTPDYLGTYMVLESRNKVPFVIYKPGLNGYLSEGYYFTDEAEWRTKKVFSYDPLDILEVQIQYFKAHDSSFILKKAADNSYHLEPFRIKNVNSIESDEKKIKRFLMGFTNLQYMEILTLENGKHFKDSLFRQMPAVKVSVTDINHKIKILILYLRAKDNRTKSETDVMYDPAYFYAVCNDRPDQIFIMQSLVLERILWKINNFKK